MCANNNNNNNNKQEKRLTLEVGEIALLVELGGLKTERVDDVVDLDLGVLKTLLSLLGGSIGTSV